MFFEFDVSIWIFFSLVFFVFVLFVFAQAAVRPWWVPSVGRNKKERSNFTVCTMKQSYMQVQKNCLSLTLVAF